MFTSMLKESHWELENPVETKKASPTTFGSSAPHRDNAKLLCKDHLRYSHRRWNKDHNWPSSQFRKSGDLLNFSGLRPSSKSFLKLRDLPKVTELRR
ncbi:hypothetical protein MTO96_029705 [Rhipicephalus appendiculatus]